jgi:hypothetical protein
VQARRVETSQPHIAHDHDAEQVFAVLETVRELTAIIFAADVGLIELWQHPERGETLRALVRMIGAG